MTHIRVTMEVDVDLDAWKTEYGHASAVHALREVLEDLRTPEAYLYSEKWQGLATVGKVTAVVDLGHLGTVQ